MLKQLTLRGLDDHLEQRLRALAQETGLSLNRAALLMMRRGAGRGEAEPEGVIGSSLDDFIGVWTEEEAAEIDQAVEDLRRIDREMWK